MNDGQTTLEVVSDEQGFIALEREWNALWLKAHGRYFQRFDVCLLAWRHVAKPRNRKLHCIVLRERGELRLVWPLVSWRRIVWNYLLPLSPDAADYTSVLVEDGPGAAALIESAWRAACARCKADFVHLPYMNEGSELHRIALREPRVLGLSRHESWIATLRGEGDWSAFSRSLGTMHGKKPGQLERRLAKEGQLSVQLMDPSDTEGITRCVQSMLAWKRQWAERTGKKGVWLFSTQYQDYLIATLTTRGIGPDAEPPARMTVVMLDAQPIAAAIVSHGNPLANAVIGSFDPEHGRFGAGAIAWEHGVRWALEHGYDIDFGVGSERFKSYWSRGNRGHAWTMQIANTTWGLVGYRTVRWLRDMFALVKGALLGAKSGHRETDDTHERDRSLEHRGK